MSKKIHERSVLIAGDVSGDLRQAIRSVGPVALRKRRSAPLTETLCRAVAGQQLSGKAAATIWGRVIEFIDGRSLSKTIAYLSRGWSRTALLRRFTSGSSSRLNRRP